MVTQQDIASSVLTLNNILDAYDLSKGVEQLCFKALKQLHDHYTPCLDNIVIAAVLHLTYLLHPDASILEDFKHIRNRQFEFLEFEDFLYLFNCTSQSWLIQFFETYKPVQLIKNYLPQIIKSVEDFLSYREDIQYIIIPEERAITRAEWEGYVNLTSGVRLYNFELYGSPFVKDFKRYIAHLASKTTDLGLINDILQHLCDSEDYAFEIYQAWINDLLPDLWNQVFVADNLSQYVPMVTLPKYKKEEILRSHVDKLFKVKDNMIEAFNIGKDAIYHLLADRDCYEFFRQNHRWIKWHPQWDPFMKALPLESFVVRAVEQQHPYVLLSLALLFSEYEVESKIPPTFMQSIKDIKPTHSENAKRAYMKAFDSVAKSIDADNVAFICAAINHVKPYAFEPTVLAHLSDFESYLTAIKQVGSSRLASPQLFLLEHHGHWICGQWQWGAKGFELIIIDSLGINAQSELSFATDSAIILAKAIIPNLSIFLNAEKLQHGVGSGCKYFAITIAQHLASHYQFLPGNQAMFEYVQANKVGLSLLDDCPQTYCFSLPPRLLLTKRSRQLFSFFKDNKTSINKAGETAQEAFKKYFTLDAHGEPYQNKRLIIELEKWKGYAKDYLKTYSDIAINTDIKRLQVSSFAKKYKHYATHVSADRARLNYSQGHHPIAGAELDFYVEAFTSGARKLDSPGG